ncbi:MAG: hypothetical protein N2C14_14685 [Planctomycetales bacterium]
MNKLRQQLVKVHHLIYPHSVKNAQEVIENIFVDYGVSEAKPLPDWFCQIWDMVLSRRPGKIYFDNPSWYLSMFVELEEELGWPMENYGEGIEMEFPATNIELFVSLEDRGPEGQTCSCTVSVGT